MNNNFIYRATIGLLIIFIMKGCVDGDYSECGNRLSISFRYIANSQGLNLFDQSVTDISVSLFNANGIYVTSQKELVSNLINNDYMMNFPVNSNGRYSILALGDTDSENYIIGTKANNRATNRLIPNVSHISDFQVEVLHDNYVVNRELGHLFISNVKDVLVDGIGNKYVTVDLIKNSKNIHLTINGLDHISNFYPVIKSTNGIYNAVNIIPNDAEEITYKPHTINETLNHFQTSMLRIMDYHKIPLIIQDKNGNNIDNIEQHDLLYLIKLNPKYKTQQDLDNEDEFKLVLNYSEDILINVIINSWKHIFVIPEL